MVLILIDVRPEPKQLSQTLPYSVERDVEVLHGDAARYHHPLALADGDHLEGLLRGNERHSVV